MTLGALKPICTGSACSACAALDTSRSKASAAWCGLVESRDVPGRPAHARAGWEGDISLARCMTACQHMRRRYHDTEHLSVTCGQRVLAPGASTDIVLAFTPREQRVYAEKLRIVILGLSTARHSHDDTRPCQLECGLNASAGHVYELREVRLRSERPSLTVAVALGAPAGGGERARRGRAAADRPRSPAAAAAWSRGVWRACSWQGGNSNFEGMYSLDIEHQLFLCWM